MNKSWLITGTSTGLGRILTERLLQRGDRVVATLRQPGALDQLAARYQEQLCVVPLDVIDVAAIKSARETGLRLGRAHRRSCQ